MRRLLEFGFRRSPWVLAVAALLTVLAAWALPGLRLDVSSASLIQSESDARLVYEAVRDEFGSDLVAVVYAEDPALFTLERLERLRAIHEQAEDLPFVERVDSLFSLPDIRDVGGLLETSPLLSRLPREPDALEAKRAQGTENPLLRGNVLSADGTATLLTLYLDPEAVSENAMPSVAGDLEALLEPHRDAFEALFQLGKPAVQTWLRRALEHDQRAILPFAALLLLLLLAVNQRSLSAGILPVFNGILATVWTLGLMSALGLPVTLLNYIVPVLVIVVGATEDMHILHELRTHLRAGKRPEEALRLAADGIGLALLLTAGTTILGFAATATSDLPILRSFGIAAVIAMTTRFLISVLVLPASVRPLASRLRGGRAGAVISPALSARMSQVLMRQLVPRWKPIFAALAALAGLAAWSAREIELSNDLSAFLDPDTVLHQQIERAADHLAGSRLLFLTLEGEPGDFQDPDKLARLDAIAAYLRTFPEFDTVIAFSDLVKRINQQLRGGAEADFALPGSRAAVSQMLLFTRPEDFAAYVSRDYARANIVIRCAAGDPGVLERRANEIEAALASGRFGPQVFSLTGETLLVARAADAIVKAQVVSLGGMIVVLFGVVAALFLSLRCGVLTVLANLFPILLIFGLMGAMDISLNVGTCMIAAITLGIAIDDTLHLLVRFNRELKSTQREKTALEHAVQHELNPIVSTSFALAGGFLVLALSSFGPVREFGALSAIVLLLAMVTDLAVTPMLFAHTRLITLWDIVGLSLRERLLRESPMLRGFSRWQAKKVILASRIEEVGAGTRLIRHRELGRTMYLVLAGELEASVGEGPQRTALTRLRVGDVLGEVALVARVRRSADVTALSDARLLALDQSSLWRLQRFSPYLASKLFLNLAAIIGERLAERINETAPPFPTGAPDPSSGAQNNPATTEQENS